MVKPLVTIIIPNRNNETYLREAISSCANQTLKDIEIIIVDDASTDNSVSIINEASSNDPRIKVLLYADRKSQSQARKDAVDTSLGKYIFFLDSDDFIEPDTCLALSNILETDPSIDAACCKTNIIINNKEIPNGRLESLDRFLNPKIEGILSGNMAKQAFLEKKFPFTLWNKMYKGDMCREAFAKVKDGFYPKAQDLYAAFFLLIEIKKIHFANISLYNYRFGGGVAGTTNLSLEQFDIICHQGLVADEIDEYCAKRLASGVKDIANEIRRMLQQECYWKWKTQLPFDLKKMGYDIMCRRFGAKEIFRSLILDNHKEHLRIASVFDEDEEIGSSNGKVVKKIALYYHRLSMGGCQKIVWEQSVMLEKAGYEVYLILEELGNSSFDVTHVKKIIQIPRSKPNDPNAILKHSEGLWDAVEENDIDLVIYHSGSSHNLLWDLIALKSCNVKSIVVHHESFNSFLTGVSNFTSNRHKVFNLADKLVALTKAADTFYKTLGINATFIPNPVNLYSIKDTPETYEILAIGRPDDAIKQYDHMLIALKSIKSAIPDVNLNFVGEFLSEDKKAQFISLAKRLDVYDNITLCGKTSDPRTHYRRCNLLLCTSSSEGFSLVIAEAKSFGLPVVSYSLPYLDILRDGKGVICVPQGDIEALASASIKVLSDFQLQKILSEEAHESMKEFSAKYNFEEMWIELIRKVSDGTHLERNKIDPEFTIILESIIDANNTRNKPAQSSSDKQKPKLKIGAKIKREISRAFLKHFGIKVFT